MRSRNMLQTTPVIREKGSFPKNVSIWCVVSERVTESCTVRCMMYGFGDDQNPYTESVDMLEDMVIAYITEVICKAMDVGKSGRVQVEDIMYLVRTDPKKFARVKDLLSMNEELKKARKAFDEVKYAAI